MSKIYGARNAKSRWTFDLPPTLAATPVADTDLVPKVYVDELFSQAQNGIAITIGDGASDDFTITHEMNTKDLIVNVYEVVTGDHIECAISVPTVDTIVLRGLNSPPGANSLRLVAVPVVSGPCSVVGF
jgi:hypothetical protein